MNEHELIKAIINGEEQAYKELFNLYSDRVYNTAISIIQNQQDAEDITQEVFIEVFKSISTFRKEASLFTWIYKVTTSKCSDHIRKQRAKKRISFILNIFDDNHNLQYDKPHFEHPGIILENKEHGKALFYALQKLPTKQQIAFTLHKVEGLSYAQIATVMNTTIPAVESLLFRSGEKLKHLLSEYYNKNIKHGASNLKGFLLTL